MSFQIVRPGPPIEVGRWYMTETPGPGGGLLGALVRVLRRDEETGVALLACVHEVAIQPRNFSRPLPARYFSRLVQHLHEYRDEDWVPYVAKVMAPGFEPPTELREGAAERALAAVNEACNLGRIDGATRFSLEMGPCYDIACQRAPVRAAEVLLAEAQVRLEWVILGKLPMLEAEASEESA